MEILLFDFKFLNHTSLSQLPRPSSIENKKIKKKTKPFFLRNVGTGWGQCVCEEGEGHRGQGRVIFFYVDAVQKKLYREKEEWSVGQARFNLKTPPLLN